MPEQTSKHWLAGGDAMPLPVSLDPARRGAWESALIRSSERPDSNRTAEGADSSKTTSTGVAKGVDTVSGTTAAETMQSGSEATEAKSQTAATDSASKPSIDDLPPLRNGETHASTSYKVRIMGHHIGEQLEEHRKLGGEGPLMIGLQGPQGCGRPSHVSRTGVDFEF